MFKNNKICKCGSNKSSNNPQNYSAALQSSESLQPPSNQSPNFEYFTEHSSIHGIRYLSKLRNNNFSRIFWTLSLIMSLIGLIYNGKRLYIKLNVSPDIGISVKHELSREVPFPAISLCLPIFAKKGMANLTHYLEEYYKNGEKNVLDLTETEKKYLAANAMRCGNNRLNPVYDCCKDVNISNIVQLMDESSPMIDEALMVCSVQLKIKDCTTLYQRILTDQGFCFTTNMQRFDTIFKEAELSEDFKIYMERPHLNASSKINNFAYWTLDGGYINKSVNNVVPLRLAKANMHALRVFSTLDDANNKCSAKNIMVKLHLPNEIPTLFHRGYQFEHKHSERLILTAKATKAHESLRNYSPQQRGCYFSDERKLQFFNVYTKNHCYLECLTNHVLRKCGCVAFHMPRNSSTEICDLDNGMCLHNCIYQWPSDDDMPDAKTPCECYPTCNYIEYSVQEIDTLYDSARSPDAINNYSSELLYSKLFVYFDDHIIQVNEKYVSYKLQNFIADIGGLLGLFLGCSLLSMIEVLYFICMALKERYFKKEISFNFGVKKTSVENHHDFLKTMDKIGEDVYVIRTPLYNRGMK